MARLSPGGRPADAGAVRVLVADDQGFWRQALRETLAGQGHVVHCVGDGESALAELERDPTFDLLVTDWVMPGLSGPELCRRARALPRERYLSILLLTSRDTPADLASALESGADAFLRKPFREAELLGQVRVAERILGLEAGLAARIAELDRDLAHAAEVQRSFLPVEPPVVPGVSFAWHHEPCAALGGDFFNVLRISADHVAVYVLDVSGHGTPAALHTVSLSHALHDRTQQGGLLKRIGEDGRGFSLVPPDEVAAELNRRFPLMARSGHFATFLYGCLDIKARCFRYVCAGHPAPVWLGPERAERCESEGGIPIGVEEEARWPAEEIHLGPGEGLLLTSDGVHETRNPAGEEFGTARLLEVARTGGRIGETVEALRAALDAFRKDGRRQDDVTVVGFRLD